MGNHVMVLPSKMVIKIAAIHNKKVGYHAVANRLEWVRMSLVRPIPLTIETLEKNGFKRNEMYLTTDFELAKDGVDIYIMVFDDGSIVVDVENNFKEMVGANRLHHCEIKYVHQLEQAMRSCRIDKEITLI